MENCCANAESTISNGKQYIKCNITGTPCICQRYCVNRRKNVHTDNVKNCKWYKQCTQDKE